MKWHLKIISILVSMILQIAPEFWEVGIFYALLIVGSIIYPKIVTKDYRKYKAVIEHRKSRKGEMFWIIMYKTTGFRYNREGYIHLPDDWQDMDRTYTAQDIYWEDKYDCKLMQERVLL